MYFLYGGNTKTITMHDDIVFIAFGLDCCTWDIENAIANNTPVNGCYIAEFDKFRRFVSFNTVRFEWFTTDTPFLTTQDDIVFYDVDKSGFLKADDEGYYSDDNINNVKEEVKDSHYIHSSFEAIDVIEEVIGNENLTPQQAYCVGNALKYLLRLGRKGDYDSVNDDLRKSINYLTRARTGEWNGN